MDWRLKKFLNMLTSRKIWLMAIGLLVALGLIDATDSQVADVVEGILTVVAFFFMAFNIAVEDGLSRSDPK